MSLKRKILTAMAVLAFLPFCSQAQTEKRKVAELDLVPMPQKVESGEGFFNLEGAKIVSDDTFNGKYLADILNRATGFGIKSYTPDQKNFKAVREIEEKTIALSIDSSYDIPEEGYILEVTPNGILAKASTSNGSFYAIQTLLQLLPPAVYGTPTGFEKWRVPSVKIEDYPRFAYRGLMMDVSRTFFGLDYIYKFLDWMAYHKLNKFHWHLTDDNGWRIEIKKYPLLTQKGAWRGPGEVLPASYGSGNKRYGGFYTQKEIKAVIKYAADRKIEIIPEIDMPGHSKAIIACYPDIGCDNDTAYVSVNGETRNVWCVGESKNYEILDDIIGELAALFPSKIIHIGGDEVNMLNWKECSTCQAFMKEQEMTREVELLHYFVRRIEKIVNKHGKVMAGWNEILEGGELRPETVVYAWQSVQSGIKAVKRGHPTVMQIGEYCYLDMKQSLAERGHNWAGVVTLEKSYSLDPIDTFNVTDKEKKLVLGVQGALWAELLNKPARFSEYQYYPRTCALAEVGWTEQSKRDFTDFEGRMERAHFDRLYNMGIAFRIEPPAVTYKGNKLIVTLPYEQAVVRYTTDRSEPSSASAIYTGDMVTYEPQKFRFATFYKDQFKSITVMADNVAEAEYLTPETSIETSFEGAQKRFPMSNITDYDFKTYWRTERTGVAGDYVTYLFKDAVACSRIVVVTGIPDIDLYGVTDGYVEISYDGTGWEKAADLVENTALIQPEEGKKVKGVRIIFTDTTDALTVSLQDLRIER